MKCWLWVNCCCTNSNIVHIIATYRIFVQGWLVCIHQEFAFNVQCAVWSVHYPIPWPMRHGIKSPTRTHTHVTTRITKRSNAIEITIIYLIHNKILNGCFYHFNVCLHLIVAVAVWVKVMRCNGVELLNYYYYICIMVGRCRITNDTKHYKIYSRLLSIQILLSNLAECCCWWVLHMHIAHYYYYYILVIHSAVCVKHTMYNCTTQKRSNSKRMTII